MKDGDGGALTEPWGGAAPAEFVRRSPRTLARVGISFKLVAFQGKGPDF